MNYQARMEGEMNILEWERGTGRKGNLLEGLPNRELMWLLYTCCVDITSNYIYDGSI